MDPKLAEIKKLVEDMIATQTTAIMALQDQIDDKTEVRTSLQYILSQINS
jgi:hypothetical protein